MATGFFVTHPLTRRASRGLGRQLRAHGLRRGRRDGRAGARRARLRVREASYGLPIKQVIQRTDRRARSTADAWQEWYGDKEAGALRQQRQVRRARVTRRPSMRSRRISQRKGSARSRCMAPARLGHLAPALLGHADPDHPLRGVRCRAGAGKGSAGRAARGSRAGWQRQSAEQGRALPRVHVPEVRQAGAARNRHDGHVRRFVVVLHALLLPGRDDAWSTSAPTTGCRWISTSAASSTRCCTCCMRASGPR